MIKKLFQINLYVLVYERFMSPLENSIFFQIPKNSGRTHSGSFNFLFSFLVYPNPLRSCQYTWRTSNVKPWIPMVSGWNYLKIKSLHGLKNGNWFPSNRAALFSSPLSRLERFLSGRGSVRGNRWNGNQRSQAPWNRLPLRSFIGQTMEERGERQKEKGERDRQTWCHQIFSGDT